MEEGMSSHPPGRLGGGAQGGAGSESGGSGARRRAGRACHRRGGERALGFGSPRAETARAARCLILEPGCTRTGKGGWLAGGGV